MSDANTYQINRPVRHDHELYREGTIKLNDKDAKPLLDCGAISEATLTSETDEQSNSNSSQAPVDPAERITLIKAAITKMEEDKVDGDWTQKAGPKLKPLGAVVGWEVNVEERDQAFAELHPAPQE